MTARKVWAVCGGSDWADAQVDHLVLPDGCGKDWIEEQKKEYHKGCSSMMFHQWLIAHGARPTCTDEVEAIWD